MKNWNLTKMTLALAAAAVVTIPSVSSAQLISLDFDEEGALNTQSGDVNAENGINVAGLIFSGQNGAWNSLAFAKNWPEVNNATQTITDMLDGDGNATTVDFTYNTGGEAVTYRQLMFPFDGTGEPSLRTDHFVLNDAAAVDPATSVSVDWEISGLTPGGVYDLILFGQSGPANESTFTIFGNPLTNDAEFDGNATGIVANPDGKITGTHEAQGEFDSWDGLQIRNQETDTTPLTLGSLSPFTGGDAGEGLDLSGNIIYAFNLGGTAQTVQGVDFVATSVAEPPAGIVPAEGILEFNYFDLNGGNATDYGDSADDDALENMTTVIWYNSNWTFDLVTVPGTRYQLQLILQEGWIGGQGTTTRNFDVSVETASPSTLSLGVDDLVLGMETNGAFQDGDDFGLVYTYIFTAPDSSFRVALDESVAGSLAVLAAVTLEDLGVDTTAPNLSALDPVDDATGVPTISDLVVTFDEIVVFGTGNITIKESVGDAVVEAFDVTTGVTTLPPPLLVSLDFDEEGALNTQSGDVNAENGINVAGLIFSGQNGVWNSLAFAKNWPEVNNSTQTITDMLDGDGNATTVDFTYNTGGEAVTYRQLMFPFDGTGEPPLRTDHFVLNDAAAVDPATSVSVDWEISGLKPGGVYDLILFGQSGPANESTFTIFGNPLTNDAEFDGNATGIVANPDGKITGTHEAQGEFDSWDGLQIQEQLTSPKLLLSGASVTINPSANLKGNTGYYVQIDPDAIEDHAGNSFAGITDTTTWSFTTAAADVNEPAIVTLDPANGATDASRLDTGTGKSFLALAFDEEVRKGAGAIVIRLTGDDTVVDTIDVNSAAVTVSGAQITIVLNVVLPPLTSLYVEIDPGAFLDLAGNGFAGIRGSGTWTFTTDDTPSSFGSLTPFTGGDAGEGLDLSGNIVYAFNLGGILGTQTVQGVDFLDADFANPPVGITTMAGFEFDYTTTNGGNSADYGDSADDDALENIVTYIWYDNHWTFDLAVDPGTEYKLQLILQEGWNGAQGTDTRNFDISVETASPSTLSLGVNDLVLGMETNGAFQDGDDFGLVYTYQFTAADSSFQVALDESVAGSLAVLTAVTLEQLSAAIPLELSVTENGANLDFEWDSRDGMQYHLVTSTDLATPVNTWPIYDDGTMTYGNIPATGATILLAGVPKVDPMRFFALIEEPVPPLFSEDFEEGIGDFTIVDHSDGGTGTVWAHGDPMSGSADAPNIGGFVDSGNGRSTNCVGTDIGNPGFYTADTDTSLRSRIIDLTGVAGATLSFAEALDIESGDTAEVHIIDDTDDDPATNIIAVAIYIAEDSAEGNARWSRVPPIAIPEQALGQPVRIEWRFTRTGGVSADYMGWYIDDVLITETRP